MGCCDGLARFLLIVFNLIFWLTGAAILGVGVWFLVDKNINSYFDVLELDTEDPYFKYAAYILIAFGGFVFLVGFCGCCGAIRSSKCLLGFVDKKVDELLMKSLKTYPNSTTMASKWDFVQIQLECCGVKGPNDYDNITLSGNKAIPLSCCKLSNRNEAIENPASAVAKNATMCMEKKGDYIYSGGCKDKVLSMAQQYTMIIIAVGFSIGLLEFFGIVFAICLCRQAGKDED
ncbi:hypothetical protein KUTeg_022780 [Tegillarca granosa]|uniref:Tetraspanin n=1 Tax=Tegillarca granosa TaxID=220873 RepID=A0ABQ9E5J1_TEGGR|nr:hypothetical protein KUTeg_022780 [Tegillarca granosa]